MAKQAAKPVKTFHYLDMQKSLEVQNQQVGMLLQVVANVLSLTGEALPAALREPLQREADATHAIMWPQMDDELT